MSDAVRAEWNRWCERTGHNVPIGTLVDRSRERNEEIDVDAYKGTFRCRLHDETYHFDAGLTAPYCTTCETRLCRVQLCRVQHCHACWEECRLR